MPSPGDAGPLDTEAVTSFGEADLLVVLHARRCASAAKWWREHRGTAPMIVALAGTDLYVDMPANEPAMATVRAADHLVVLQRNAAERLELLMPGAGERTTVIHQSVARPVPPRTHAAGEFRVVVLAHLRDVKDPLMAARASRLVAPGSSIAVHHAGAPHDLAWRSLAEKEVAANPRYHWHEELSTGDAMELLASSDVLACTSLQEGGANVVTEAIALGVPVVGTYIDGNTGLLGDDYPGLVPVGDKAALAELLEGLESTPTALAELQARTDELAPITYVDTEREAWHTVLSNL